MNLKNWTSDHTKGLILGLIFPLLFVPLVMWILSIVDGYFFEQLWHKFTVNNPYRIKVITLSIIANLGIFYFFLNRERYNFAMGIILGSLCYAPYIIYIKFF